MAISVSSTLPHLSTPCTKFLLWSSFWGIIGSPVVCMVLLKSQFIKLSETAVRLCSPVIAGHSPSWNRRSCHYPPKTLRRSGLSTFPYSRDRHQTCIWCSSHSITLLILHDASYPAPNAGGHGRWKVDCIDSLLPGALWCSFQAYSSTLGWCNCLSNQSPIC